MTVTQGGTQTRDLANGLPCSNQLSYQVIRQLPCVDSYADLYCETAKVHNNGQQRWVSNESVCVCVRVCWGGGGGK